MTRAHTFELESLVLFAFAAVAGVIAATYFHNGPKVRTVFNLPVVAPFVSPTPTATPTPVSKVANFSQVAPNGLKKVTMTVTTRASDKTYTFTTTNEDGSNSVQIYSVNLPTDENMSIPFNTFSPDDKYLFIDHVSSNNTEPLVFRADGQQVGDNSQYFNVKDIFTARTTGNTYDTTTGWASETLLIVNSKTPNSNTQSYWVEIPSKAVIPLSTEF